MARSSLALALAAWVPLGCGPQKGSAGSAGSADSAQVIAPESTSDAVTCLTDQDGDGFPGEVEVVSDDDDCDDPGEIADAGVEKDCDDLDPTRHPGADELPADGVDQDCDRLELCYDDLDRDGYRVDSTHASADLGCAGVGDALESAEGGDCDDTDPTTHPDAPEVCDDGEISTCDGDTGRATWSCALNGGLYPVSSADAVLVGEAAGDLAGREVSPAGDVNGDGLGDVLVSAACTSGCLWPTVYVVLGGMTGEHLLSDAQAVLTGEAERDWAGWSTSAAGDTDGDGLSEVLIGAWANEQAGGGAGAAYLVAGGMTGALSLTDADARLYGDHTNSHAGSAVAGVGDTDADGRYDLLIGAPDARVGRAYLVGGGVHGTLSLADADALVVSDDETTLLGDALSGTGDTDGDGLADLLIGARPNLGGWGYAYLVLGGVAGEISSADADLVMTGANAYDEAGLAVAGAGDTDGDGLADLLVGAPEGGESYGGEISLVLGGTLGALSLGDADATLTSEQLLDFAGGSVAGAGDVNTDGCSDVLVGSNVRLLPDAGEGTVYLALGPLSGEIPLSRADAKFYSAGGELHGPVAGAGDTNGDGRGDLLIGAYSYSEGAEDRGAAYVLTDLELPY